MASTDVVTSKGQNTLEMIITIMSQLYTVRFKIKPPEGTRLQPERILVSGKDLSRLASAEVRATSALLVAALNRCIAPPVPSTNTDDRCMTPPVLSTYPDWWTRLSAAKRCAMFHAFRLAVMGVPDPQHYLVTVDLGQP